MPGGKITRKAQKVVRVVVDSADIDGQQGQQLGASKRNIESGNV